LAKTIPVKPPNVNKKIKPYANNVIVLKTTLFPHKVANQENTLTPVGTPITNVAAEKYALLSISIPVVNI
jgi:hypothetical protein